MDEKAPVRRGPGQRAVMLNAASTQTQAPISPLALRPARQYIMYREHMPMCRELMVCAWSLTVLSLMGAKTIPGTQAGQGVREGK